MLWIQGLHVIFVVTWFAGLFYLPRIFVYYAQAEDDTTRMTLAIMARKLYKFVTPLMMLAIILGLWRLSYALDYYLTSLWMQLKLAGVVFLLIYHVQCGRYVTLINSGDDHRSHVFYRFFNEIPVLFLFAIVLLVYVRPG
ncbi:MAG: CopD family protein [Luminiphilus sp.]|nr:CopD family protein [Luminiphilus sp.]MDG1654509.1 CopD family protein [Luminiphilus sp.]